MFHFIISTEIIYHDIICIVSNSKGINVRNYMFIMNSNRIGVIIIEIHVTTIQNYLVRKQQVSEDKTYFHQA